MVVAEDSIAQAARDVSRYEARPVMAQGRRCWLDWRAKKEKDEDERQQQQYLHDSWIFIASAQTIRHQAAVNVLDSWPTVDYGNLN